MRVRLSILVLNFGEVGRRAAFCLELDDVEYPALAPREATVERERTATAAAATDGDEGLGFDLFD